MMHDTNGIHIFSALGRRYAFDIFRLHTYELSESACQLLSKILINTSSNLDKNNYINKLSFEEILDFISLINAGLIREGNPFELPKCASHPDSKSIVSVVLNVAEDCNFGCTYCFGQQGLYQRTKGQLMSLSVGKSSVDWLMERSGDSKKVNICFFGGEPLLNIPLIREIVTYANEKGRSLGKKVTYNITTNASLLDSRTVDLLNSLGVRFQISLDGIDQENDVHRRLKNGAGSWRIIERNLEYILKTNNSITVRTTVAHGNIHINKIVNDILGYGFYRVFVCPATGIDGAAVEKEDINILLKELEELAEQYLQSARSGNLMAGFENIHREVRRLWNPRPRFTGCAAGNTYFTIGVEGDIFVCMHVVYPGSPYRIGNVLTGEFDEVMHSIYQKITVDDKEDCSKCWARYLCGNACFARNLNMGCGFDKADPDFCAFETKTYELALAIVARLKEDGNASPFQESEQSAAIDARPS